MALSNVIVGAAIFLLILSSFMFSKQWKGLFIIFGGLFSSLVQDTAKTPEGARAIFNEKIDEVQKEYNRAQDILKNYSGKLRISEENFKKLESEISDIERKCEQLVKNGNISEANILAEKREELLIEKRNQKETAEKLRPMVMEAETICSNKQKQLKALKIKSKEIVSGLELNKQISDMYDDFDELKKTSQTDKLLESIEDGYSESKQKAIGSKVVHENRIETKSRRAIEKANKLTSNSYIEELQKKYKK